MKALIVFATRTGWTRKSAELIAQELKRLGYEVLTCDGKLPRLVEGVVESCDIVVVGSGLRAGEWGQGPKQFLRKFGSKIRNLSVFITDPGTLYSVEKNGLGHAWAVATAVGRFVTPFLNRLNLHPRHVVAFGGEIAWIKHHKENNWVQSDIIKWADSLDSDTVAEQTKTSNRSNYSEQYYLLDKDKKAFESLVSSKF